MGATNYRVWIFRAVSTDCGGDRFAYGRDVVCKFTSNVVQRTIDLCGSATFRQLLLQARQELAHEYLNRPEMDVAEVAFLLGYEDSNSFYRAFRTWEGTTPSQLRAALKRSETRQ